MLIAQSSSGPDGPIPGIRKILALVLILAATFGVGAVGAWVTAPNIPEWYESLNKPNFNPPNWLFAPIWSALYLLVSIAIWLAWQSAPAARRLGLLAIYGGHLALNMLWSIFFFAMHLPLLAYIDCLLLALVIAWMMVRFRRVNRFAAWLLAPYLLWVAFATLLNIAIVLLN
ncbi:MAG TPA: TspO/MBR family protein [Terriglobia bacterium]|nr:TspO/MBR family protein [Terriglobia bacterium]